MTGGAAAVPARRRSGLPDAGLAPVLGALLEASGLGMVEQLGREDAGRHPFWQPAQGVQALAGLEALPALVVRLFCLGERVDEAEAIAVLDAPTIAELVLGGVLAREDDDVRSPWRVVTYLQRHVLATPPAYAAAFDPSAPVAYVGPESLYLAPVVAGARRCGRALEIGPGSGLLTALLPADEVTAVEIDPFAAEVARFNAELNGLEHVSVREGGGFAPVRDERFDLVVSNPPFLPAPEGVALPACGDGGPHGDRVLRALLAGLPDHLEAEGRAILYGEDLGDASEPALAGWLRDTWPGPHDVTMHVTHTRFNERTALRLTALWEACGATQEAAWAAWRALLADRPASHHHSFVIDVTPGVGRVHVVRRTRF